MNIGIVTLPLNNNYGGILQNYALQQALIKLGHKPTTIYYRFSLPFPRNVLSIIKQFLLGKKLSALHTAPEFKKFISDNIYITQPLRKYSADLISSYKFDVLIAGSDQIWRPRYSPFCFYDMFLDFAIESRICKISYAASFGTSKWELNQDQTKKSQKLLGEFKAISVREDTAVDLCNEKLQLEAVHVIDPTMLLSRNDYERLVDDNTVVDKNQLTVYLLDITSQLREQIELYAKENNLTPVYLSSDTFDKNKTVSIGKWLAYISKSKMIITDSFHGTVFSIIFKREFRTIVNQKRGADRFYSLFRKLNICDHVVDIDNISFDAIDINWNEVDQKITEWRKFSYDFLNSNIV